MAAEQIVTLLPLFSYVVHVEGQNVGTVNIDELPFELPPYELGEHRICRMLIRPGFQNRGLGTRLMARLCDDADAAKKSLVLEASPYGGRQDLPKLLRFYRRAGFEVIASDILMRRLPR